VVGLTLDRQILQQIVRPPQRRRLARRAQEACQPLSVIQRLRLSVLAFRSEHHRACTVDQQHSQLRVAASADDRTAQNPRPIVRCHSPSMRPTHVASLVKNRTTRSVSISAAAPAGPNCPLSGSKKPASQYPAQSCYRPYGLSFSRRAYQTHLDEVGPSR
jgi:hypothetical protein